MELIQEFSLRKQLANQNLIMGGIIVLISIIMFFLIGNLMMIGPGILLLVIGGLNQNLKVVKVYPEYLEVKLGVLASKKFIRYNQITQFKAVNKILEIHYNTDEGKSKKVRIAKRALEQEDIIAINNFLSEHTDLDSNNSWINE
ncbi:hypothetical protein [Aquimarina spongiae]|uniref:Uncharacterized protein n=1 Tax=Aquimarina spongiae TaxID=570521 RepID=A0A1M6CDC7_9FLAO|nr:hypothetical protein [Aquimarina spongiae]SHI58811.1 hypothetical protein SAMN04488508_10255 [Aquimarina spongiae]